MTHCSNYREVTKVVLWDHRWETPHDVLEGPCQRCGEVMEKERWNWEETLFCSWCVSIEAEDALA